MEFLAIATCALPFHGATPRLCGRRFEAPLEDVPRRLPVHKVERCLLPPRRRHLERRKLLDLRDRRLDPKRRRRRLHRRSRLGCPLADGRPHAEDFGVAVRLELGLRGDLEFVEPWI